MKRVYIFIVTAILFLTGTAFQKKKKTTVLQNAKTISANLAKIKPGLYAWKTETSNGEYRLFLQSMRLTHPQDWEKFAVDSTQWRADVYYNEPFVNYYHQHPAFEHYPVVNISYESALEYCKWLTTIYHNDEKRKFKKCVFVLPAKEEWQYAASGGDLTRTYPWGSGFVQNKKGSYLSNFKKEKEEMTNLHTGDKAIYTANTKSFFPNSFGLYNCSGNVAEMLEKQNEAAGGSWNSPVYLTQINSIQNYTKASPEIGMRIFMRVIEE